MEDSSENSSKALNGEKTQAINEENIAKAAASALAAAAVKAKVTVLLIIWCTCIVHNLNKMRSHRFGNNDFLKSVLWQNTCRYISLRRLFVFKRFSVTFKGCSPVS